MAGAGRLVAGLGHSTGLQGGLYGNALHMQHVVGLCLLYVLYHKYYVLGSDNLRSQQKLAACIQRAWLIMGVWWLTAVCGQLL